MKQDSQRHASIMRADGLYRVTTSYLCAGFVIEGAKVTHCAPILRRRIGYWMTVAERIET